MISFKVILRSVRVQREAFEGYQNVTPNEVSRCLSRQLQHMRVMTHQEGVQQLRIVGTDRGTDTRPMRQLL